MGPASKYPQADRAYPLYNSAYCDGVRSCMFRIRQVEAHTSGKDDDQEDERRDQPKARSTKIEGMAAKKRAERTCINGKCFFCI